MRLFHLKMLVQRYLFLFEGLQQLAHVPYLELCIVRRRVALVRSGSLIDLGSFALRSFTSTKNLAFRQLTFLLTSLDLVEKTQISKAFL